MELKKGFIYTAPRPPYKPFTFQKTKSVLEFEELSGQILTDEQAFCYNLGYEMGLVDGECETILRNLNGGEMDVREH